MNVIDDMLNTNNNSSSYNKKSNNKNSKWLEEQNKMRKWCYDNMNDMAIKLKNDGNILKQYLDIQARFEKYSSGNSLLILKQNPNATYFKDKKGWEEDGVSLVATPNKIIILEPTKSNEQTYFNPKEEYDITQTNAKPTEKNPYNVRKVLEGIVYNCYANIKPVDELPDNQGLAHYNKEENVLYISRGMDVKQLFQVLSYYMADIEMRNQEDLNYKQFKNQCISYMLCKRYQIDAPNYSFSEIPQEISQLDDGKAIRKELENIRINFETIDERLLEGIEKNTKTKQDKKKEQER